MTKLNDYKNFFETKMNEALSTVREHINNGVPVDEGSGDSIIMAKAESLLDKQIKLDLE